MIALQSALTLPSIHKISIYEPPFFLSSPDGALPTALIARHETGDDRGKDGGGADHRHESGTVRAADLECHPPPAARVARQHGDAKRGEERIGRLLTDAALAPTLHNDFRLVSDMGDTLGRFEAIRAEVLLLGGSKSPAYLKRAV